jgi:hypothetical protein
VTAVSFNERIEGMRGARLVFENKRQPYNGEKPKAIRKQNVVKELPQLELNKLLLPVLSAEVHFGDS